jgi:hypothetical protein
MTDPRRAAFRREHPRPHGPGRVVPDVLGVSALQFHHPMTNGVFLETAYFPVLWHFAFLPGLTGRIEFAAQNADDVVVVGIRIVQ